MSKKRFFFLILNSIFLLSSFFYIKGEKWENYDLITNIFYLISFLVCLLVAVYGTKIYGLESIYGKTLFFFSLALFSRFVGEILWIVFDFILEINPYPSLADIFYLGMYPLLLIGLFIEIKKGNLILTPKRTLFFGIVFFPLAALIFYFGGYLAYNPEETFFENLFAIFYNFADLILLAAVLLVLMIAKEYMKGKIFSAWVWIFFGLTFILVADVLFSIFTENYENHINPIYFTIDLFWIGGALSLAQGIFEMVFLVKEIQSAAKKISPN